MTQSFAQGDRLEAHADRLGLTAHRLKAQGDRLDAQGDTGRDDTVGGLHNTSFMQIVRPRLRLDKVAKAVIADIQTALRDDVPDGMTVIFTITAPIRLASNTTEALEAEIRALLKSRAEQPEIARTINANQIRVRIVRTRLDGQPNVIGFVHNPDPGVAQLLLDSPPTTHQY